MTAFKHSALPSQILLWSLPRSGCHLLEKMVFSKQGNLKYCWHPNEAAVIHFHNLFSGQDIQDEANQNRKGFESKCREAAEAWRTKLQEAQDANHTLYMHEHAFFTVSPERMLEVLDSPSRQGRADPSLNFTTAPDDLLLFPGTVPLISIRNPILSVPSAYRAMNTLYTGATRANWLISTQLCWNRDLYDYFVSHGIEPIVVDADDYMTSEVFVRHLTGKLGLDPDKAIVSWPKSTDKEKQDMSQMLLTIQNTLVNSEGIRPDRASRNIDLAAERENWKNDFDKEELKMIQEFVDIAMPHYEYLREKRLRL